MIMSKNLDKKTQLPFLKESSCIDDLHLKSVPELKELLDRQNNLLKKKDFLNKLKDKGEKVILVKERIEAELKSRETKSNIPKHNAMNINAWEWRDPNKKERRTSIDDDIETKEENVLQILAQNGNIPNTTNRYKSIPHVKKLIGTEHEAKFSFKPYVSLVDKKLKKIIPEAHTEEKPASCTKSIHLDESLELLTKQLLSLKVIENTSKSKRAEECIDDRIDESNLVNSDTEDHEEYIVND